jgi:hypothetical protein
MTRSALLYAIGGFFLGSAAATVVSYSLTKRQKPKKKDDDDASTKDDALSTSLKRSILATSGAEHVSFLTEIIKQLWDYLNVAGGDMIRETMEPMLSKMTPAISLQKMDLGHVPIQLDNIVVHQIDKEKGILQFDMDLIWDGECDIQLKANYIGNFGVRGIKLKGRLCVLLKPLTNQLPVVSAIQYAFINPPSLKLNFTGFAQVADFAVINSSIKQVIHQSLAAMVVLPNRMLYKMDLASSYLDTYHAPLGIARITLVEGRGFVPEKRSLRGVDIPDVYCLTTVGYSDVWKTSTIKNSLTPKWNECADFLFTDHQQIIKIQAWDEDTGTLDPDDFLGDSKISVGELLLRGRSMETQLYVDGKESGAYVTLGCELLEWTSDLTSFQRSPDEHNTLCGLMTIIVTRAFNIPVELVKAASYVKVTHGENVFFTSQVDHYPGIDAINPQYDCAFHIPLTPKSANATDDVVFALYNNQDLLGTMNVTKESITSAPENTITERRPIGEGGASLEFRVSLQGLKEKVSRVTLPAVPSMEIDRSLPPMKPEEEEVPSEPKPIGTVRVTAVRGRGFKVQKRFMKKDDIPDLYCNVKFDSKDYIWRTSTIRNSTTPEWNESADFALLNHDQIIDLDLFDEDRRKSLVGDEKMGNVTISVGELLLAGGETEIEVKKGKSSGAFVTLRCDVVEPAPDS